MFSIFRCKVTIFFRYTQQKKKKFAYIGFFLYLCAQIQDITDYDEYLISDQYPTDHLAISAVAFRTNAERGHDLACSDRAA